jgi:hypothetical protein
VVREQSRELMTMSLKSTQLKKAKDLNTILAGAKMPSFAFKFDVTLAPEHGKGNSWYGWKFTPAGYVDEDLYNAASEFYDKMHGKTVQVETEADSEESDEKVPF